MSYSKIIINDTIEYECIRITLNDSRFHAVLNTSDCTKVIEDLQNIDHIDIYDYRGLHTNHLTEYDSYSSISLEIGQYTDYDGNLIDTVQVVFKKTSIDEIVYSLNKKINNIVDESALSVDEFKEYKITKLGDECRTKIEEGLDIETSYGVEHFTYKQDDQFNIKALFDLARLVKSDVPLHSSKNPCKMYSWQDAIKIYIALEINLLYHATYCNGLFMTIREDLMNKDDVAEVVYGQELSEARKADLDNSMNAYRTMMDSLLEKCGMNTVVNETV